MEHSEIKLWKIPFPEWNFKYAVWGVVSQTAYDLYKIMEEYVPNGKLIAGIDYVAEGIFCGSNIIRPKDIYTIPEDVIIFVTSFSVQESSQRILMDLERPFVLIKGTDVECYNF